MMEERGLPKKVADKIADLKTSKWIYHRALKEVCERHGENMSDLLEKYELPPSERFKQFISPQ
jgi:hypothetical protein